MEFSTLVSLCSGISIHDTHLADSFIFSKMSVKAVYTVVTPLSHGTCDEYHQFRCRWLMYWDVLVMVII